MKPSFIGIGAQKCASTWLHQILASHPSINVPAIKEADFFSYRYDHGFQWYERLFSERGPKVQAGEVSPSYFHDPAAPARVLAYKPDIKILLTLRDPVQRAMSNHRHEVRLGHFSGSDLSFEAGLANNPMYVEQGLYAKHLANWLRCFPRRQIHVVLVEDIEMNPQAVAHDVFQFLGIDANFRPDVLTKRFNKSISSRFDSLFRAKERMYGMTRVPGFAWIWSMACELGLRRLYRQLNTAGPDAALPSMRLDTERELRDRFMTDIEQLEQMLGRSLAHWGHQGGVEHSDSHGLASANEMEQWPAQ